MAKPKRSFAKKVAGVTFDNPDGTNRQDLLKRAKNGQPVKLIWEKDNAYSRTAIAVYNKDGQQLGYLPEGHRLTAQVKRGEVTAKIKEVTGGPGCLGQFFPAKVKTRGCVLTIFIW